jgi:hypothetical protein
MRDALGGITRRQAIDRLLETGAFRAEIVRLTPELLAGEPDLPIERLVAYKVTEFGAPVARYGRKELGFESPELQRLLEQAGGLPNAG